MKNILTLLGIIGLAWLVVVAYGIIYFEVSYILSPEYYTKNFFIEYGFCERRNCDPDNPQLDVAMIGFMMTWWMGLITGIVMALLALILRSTHAIFRATRKALVRMISVVAVAGLVGLSAGFLYLSDDTIPSRLPSGLSSPQDYIAVGNMHNFSFIGGIIGLMFGIGYLVRKRKRVHKDDAEYPLFAEHSHDAGGEEE